MKWTSANVYPAETNLEKVREEIGADILCVLFIQSGLSRGFTGMRQAQAQMQAVRHIDGVELACAHFGAGDGNAMKYHMTQDRRMVLIWMGGHRVVKHDELGQLWEIVSALKDKVPMGVDAAGWRHPSWEAPRNLDQNQRELYGRWVPAFRADLVAAAIAAGAADDDALFAWLDHRRDVEEAEAEDRRVQGELRERLASRFSPALVEMALSAGVRTEAAVQGWVDQWRDKQAKPSAAVQPAGEVKIAFRLPRGRRIMTFPLQVTFGDLVARLLAEGLVRGTVVLRVDPSTVPIAPSEMCRSLSDAGLAGRGGVSITVLADD